MSWDWSSELKANGSRLRRRRVARRKTAFGQRLRAGRCHALAIGLQSLMPHSPSISRAAQASSSRRAGADPGSYEPPIAGNERALVGVLAVLLSFMPLALGSMHVWSQFTSLGLAVIAFGCALWPHSRRSSARRSGRESEGTRVTEGREERSAAGWQRLRRFPIFWLGLLLFAYIGIQAVNSFWVYRTDGQVWWLEGQSVPSWLPKGIDAPFVSANPWRELVIYGTAWLAVCAAWSGLTRRRSLSILLGVVAINAVVIAGLLAWQQATGNARTWPWSLLTAHRLVGSIIYKNHAGAYLALASFALLTLAARAHDARVRQQRKSSPTAVYILLAIGVAVAVVFTFSRAATVLLGGAVIVVAAWLIARRWRRAGSGDSRLALVASAIVGAFAIFVGATLDFSRVAARFDLMLTQPANDYSVTSRTQAREAGLKMLTDHQWTGVGAGGFRHLFPVYASEYPEIYEMRGRRLFWEYLHNDWIELPIELGVIGMLPIAAGGVWVVAWLWRRRDRWTSPWFVLVIGCGQTVVHAAFDFPFQCPAILVTWMLLMTIAARGLERSAGRRRGEKPET